MQNRAGYVSPKAIAFSVGIIVAMLLFVVAYFVFVGGDEQPESDELAEMRREREEVRPLCKDTLLSVLSADEILGATEERNGEIFFHESYEAEKVLRDSYTVLSFECEGAMIRGMDASADYYERALYPARKKHEKKRAKTSSWSRRQLYG